MEMGGIRWEKDLRERVLEETTGIVEGRERISASPKTQGNEILSSL